MEIRKKLCVIEIVLLISLSISLSYTYGESYGTNYSESGMMEIYEKIVRSVLGNNLVSAVDAGIYTCLETNTGAVCQEYFVGTEAELAECNNDCETECVPTDSANLDACRIGTCYDPLEGTCQAGSPKKYCEDFQGDWFEDPYENINECRSGCCILGDSVIFGSQQQCIRQSSLLGLDLDYRPELDTEFACLGAAERQVSGACVFVSEDPGEKNDCRFETKSECLEQRGDFYPGYLCSNTELDTRCVPQENARCVEGKDELYWFDSCGNRENIYDSNKDRSWNDGKILSKSDSCEIGRPGDQLANQNSCGNCNYLVGSVCGASSGSERLSDRSIDFVCRDLRCVDKNGETRENGESWCEYQGAVGLDPTGVRSRDTPGSTHYRASCLDGSVEYEPCAAYRNEICVQSDTDIGGGEDFSNAACKSNGWQQCLGYNARFAEAGGTVEAGVERANKCNKNPDCVMNFANVGDFQYSVCAPKYPPGFNVRENPELAESVCSIGTATCTAIYVKETRSSFGLGAGFEWVCRANCECEDAIFAQEMHDLCMSLGDCGSSVNYNGAFSQNHFVFGSPQLSSSYFGRFLGDSNTKRGNYIDSSQFVGQYMEGQDGAQLSRDIGAILGASGGAAGIIQITKGDLDEEAEIDVSFGSGPEDLFIGYISGFGLRSTGVYRGLSSQQRSLTFIYGLDLGAIIVLSIIGIGDTREEHVTFTCLPWQAPVGGSECHECGKDGLPCTKYSCESLGQTCRLANEGTTEEICSSVSTGDLNPPMIRPLDSLPEGYNIVDESARGFRIESETNSGCISAYEEVSIGLEFDEPTRCRFDTESNVSYENMRFPFGDTNLFLYNHTQNLSFPSLERLGISGYDPTAITDYDLFLRCEDQLGNVNEVVYTINSCIRPGRDSVPPLISQHEPSGEYVGFNQSSVNAKIFVNEPSECRWSLSDQEYETMENQMECETGLLDRVFRGWPCSAELSLKESLETEFFVRCEDQPWLVEATETSGAYIEVEEGSGVRRVEVEDDRTRNRNQGSYRFTYRKTENALRIDSIEPNEETLVYGVEPASVEVTVETSGGVDGTALCEYSFGGPFISFFNTGSSRHNQVFQSFFSGNKVVNVRCEDSAGNIVTGSSNFNIEIDSTAPEITRVYDQSGSLIITTNEPGECGFIVGSESSCGFSLDDEDVILMSGSGGLIHSAIFEREVTHYVKCRDVFGNYQGSCNLVLESGEF